MFHALHVLGSRLRHIPLLERQRWLWSAIEPAWQRSFALLTGRRGFLTHINDDVFRLDYAVGARYERHDRRTYEPVAYDAWSSAIRSDMTVMDIGAHYGFFSLAAAVRVGPGGRVYAFEAAPETVAVLARHVRLNRFSDRIVVVAKVVHDRVGLVSFFTYGTSMAASLGRANVEDLNPEHPPLAREVILPSTTVDEFCTEHDLTPTLLKIDVEGAELAVVRGAARLLRRARPRVLCEIHPRQMETLGGSLAHFDACLQGCGYRIQPLGEPNSMGIFASWLEPDA